ncbi:TPA: hypothetical protein DEO28_01780 [Candidatus Dependentiae bacterium]|nr:MAG: hypothetical protein UR14_C0004G0046 [candidate division TM6 bacterium GW2011_GWE2_31_21]KKP52964.1 MAG: hypothetical protein UR43_C0008G0046 [candidate division TM6 bacterium GW2011_GWF2_33_332]HBS47798.1 hypothetical protein [Candidatus Dependentiae bacterium]HBZ73226.1 hypothetical protein [Candidatus Dependentiae bacterium]
MKNIIKIGMLATSLIPCFVLGEATTNSPTNINSKSQNHYEDLQKLVKDILMHADREPKNETVTLSLEDYKKLTGIDPTQTGVTSDVNHPPYNIITLPLEDFKKQTEIYLSKAQ